MNLLGDTSAVSILADPFSKNGITRINIYAYRQGWDSDGPFKYYSKIEFRNGGTKGEQEIKAESFPDLLTKTQAFVDSLT